MPIDLTIKDAAQILKGAKRVMVIGVSGSGKSTLSKIIAQKLDARYISLDRDVTWLPGWKQRTVQDRRDKVAPLVTVERWVMDGTYTGTFDLRVPLADLVIWLRPSRWAAMRGVLSRVWKHHGSVRDDMAEGCPEKWPDAEFLHYIWFFERNHAPRVAAALRIHGANVPLATLYNHTDSAKLIRAAFGAD